MRGCGPWPSGEMAWPSDRMLYLGLSSCSGISCLCDIIVEVLGRLA